MVKLADRIDWDTLDEQFASLYAKDGRPATATRMMVGLTLLQSLLVLSEDEVVNRWPENPHWQYLCGETFFQHQRPIVRSGLSKWRSAIEAVIGHQKTEGRLGGNRLRGVLGDTINALMAAISYNLKLILRALSFLLQILKELVAEITGNMNQATKEVIASA